ncbi:hypothetical protein LCGC14_1426430 [marine sediment metagenome]|uniref:Uncharacterized protein n=1 Tax=marine sediment metagenome TaxID=412755 RepID=A0A0F9JPW0_9ZZZZ
MSGEKEDMRKAIKKIIKKEDSIDEALRLWKELCEYEKKNGINVPTFGTMNNLGKRNKNI